MGSVVFVGVQPVVPVGVFVGSVHAADEPGNGTAGTTLHAGGPHPVDDLRVARAAVSVGILAQVDALDRIKDVPLVRWTRAAEAPLAGDLVEGVVDVAVVNLSGRVDQLEVQVVHQQVAGGIRVRHAGPDLPVGPQDLEVMLVLGVGCW